MKLWKKIAIATAMVIGVSFLVPDFTEEFAQADENVVALKLNRSGDRLLLRTVRQDYEFALPANRLNDLQPPLLSAQREALLGLGNLSLGVLRVEPAVVSGSLQIRIGGYDPSLQETKTVLSEDDRHALAELGFKPSNGNMVGDIEPSLYMAWRADLRGRKRPAAQAQNRDQVFAGADLTSLAPSQVRVVEAIDEETLARNRRLNQIFRPLTMVREAVTVIVIVPFLLLTGFTPGR
ncbi:hypothetical protein [Lysobacter gummosus]|uniref:hypothetical protein n=1 Tax=Lysobacter gummosus TaxID=262324 RepID=UPI0036330CA8